MVAKGNRQDELAAIWLRHQDALAAFIKRRSDTPEAARDILQDVAVKMVRAGKSLTRIENPKAWLHAVARNALADHFRRRRQTIALDPELPGPEPEQKASGPDGIGRCLAPMIEALPDALRKALVLADLEGLRQAEVAERLGISLSAVKSRILRGRIDLRRRIEQCCLLVFDAGGGLMDYAPRPGGCSLHCGKSR